MLFCDIYYVSTDAAYVKNFGGNFIFSHRLQDYNL